VPSGRVTVVQDATQRTGGVYLTFPGSGSQAGIVRDLPAGQPYLSDSLATTLPLLTLRSYMLQLLDDGSVDLGSVTLDGRRCWVVSTTMSSGEVGVEEPAATRVRIAADEQTLFPVRFSSWSNGRASQLRISYARGGQAPPADTFTLAIPPGVHLVPIGPDFSVGPKGSSAGFRPIPFDDGTVMTQWIGYQPAFPTWMPAGFVRTGATYADLYGTVGENGGPRHPAPDSATVSLAYRRGFDAVYVGVEPRTMQSGSMTVAGKRFVEHSGDPFGQFYGPAWRYVRSQTRDVVIRTGPFAGRVAHIVVDPSMLPHLWVRSAVSVATVSGDLSAADMVRVVESLATGEEVGLGKATAQ
jgi:hypothetical protein